MWPAMFQLVLLFTLAVFLTTTGSTVQAQAVDLADIESQMVDDEGTPLRGRGKFVEKMPFMLYPHLLDQTKAGYTTNTPLTTPTGNPAVAVSTTKPKKVGFFQRQGVLLQELIKYVIRYMLAEAVDNKTKNISIKNGNNYSNKINNYKKQSNQHQTAPYPTQPSRTPAPYGWNI